MENEHDESKKMMMGLVIGGVVGASALYFIQAAQNRRTPVLKKIGKTISEVGQLLENCNFDTPAHMMETLENKIPSGGDVVNSLTDWVDTGLTLWKKFKKG